MRTFVRVNRFGGGDEKLGLVTNDLHAAMTSPEDRESDEIRVYEDNKLKGTFTWDVDRNVWLGALDQVLTYFTNKERPARELREGNQFVMAGEIYEVSGIHRSYSSSDHMSVYFAKLNQKYLYKLSVPENLTFEIIKE